MKKNITSEQRSKASKDLTVIFLNSYYTSWRLAKVLSIKKILDSRYEFYSTLKDDIKNVGDEDGDATIAQEIKNGLFFDAISECIQYVEDVFAFIKASSKPDYFIKEFVTYYAQDVSKLIKKFDTSKEAVSKAFHFPIDYPFSKKQDQQIFDERVRLLSRLLRDCINFYAQYRQVYNKYKHGLKVGMRPFGNVYVKNQIDEDRAGRFPPYLSVFDNVNIEDAMKKGLGNKSMAILPGLTDNVMPIITQLMAENNFLRLVHIHESEINIDSFVDLARKARACLNIFKYNYSYELLPAENTVQFQLIDDYENDMYIHYAFSLDPNAVTD